MANFDAALAELDTKVDALISLIGGDDQALADALQAAADEKARADAVVADDAASDAAQDEARGDALAAVGGKIDAVLSAVVPVEVPVDGLPVGETQI